MNKIKNKEKNIIEFYRDDITCILKHYRETYPINMAISLSHFTNKINRYNLYQFIKDSILKDFSEGKNFINLNNLNELLNLAIKADKKQLPYNSVKELKSILLSYSKDPNSLFYKIAYHKNTDNLLKKYLLNRTLTNDA